MKKFEVRFHNSILPTKMNELQAFRWGEKNMPPELKRAGFKTVIFHATMKINGWEGLRINYGKVC